MTISARNQLTGTIESIKEGVVNASIVIKTKGGHKISATITLDAVKELELKVGSPATAVMKSTEVLIGVGDLRLSARNQLEAEVVEIKEGAVNAIVVVKTTGGDVLSATISLDAVKELELVVGTVVKAVIKATSVMIGI